jgi:hypothetical protein
MFTQQIALVSKTKKIKVSELQQVAAALQKQATRDLGPIWGIQATVDAFTQLKDVPTGYWPIIIREKIDDPTAAGYHSDRYRQPFALVKHEEGWALTCSHEMCEMLVDPFGNRMVASGSVKPGQGRVSYLVEVCDPSEDDSFAYSVNGIMLSDFYTPNYFDPVVSSSVRYSFTGCITKPKQVLKGGYLSWLDPASGKWWQATFFGTKLRVDDISEKMERLEGSMRSRIDRITATPRLEKGASKKHIKLNKDHATSQVKYGLKLQNHWDTEVNRLMKPRKVMMGY